MPAARQLAEEEDLSNETPKERMIRKKREDAERRQKEMS
jgi:hypothetical protein